MSKTQRTITTALWGLVVVSLLALIAMQRTQSRQNAQASDIDDPEIKAQLAQGVMLERDSSGALKPATQRSDPYVFEAPTFKLTDQDSKPFDSDSLRGKVWTASFFFSKCQGVCPGMMGRIKALSNVIDSPDAHFVYLTVNPSEDTPERLHEYATEANADAKRWHMLTGSDEEMKRIAAAFKLPYRMPAEHSGKIMLVDQQGQVQGFYESKDNEAMMQLAADVKKLTAGEAIR
jgi:protein SCO1/2